MVETHRKRLAAGIARPVPPDGPAALIFPHETKLPKPKGVSVENLKNLPQEADVARAAGAARDLPIPADDRRNHERQSASKEEPRHLIICSPTNVRLRQIAQVAS